MPPEPLEPSHDPSEAQLPATNKQAIIIEYIRDSCLSQFDALFRDPTLTYADIARKIIPNVMHEYPNTARRAVLNASRILIPEEEREVIGKLRNSESSKRNMREKIQRMGEEAFKAHQTNAIKASWRYHRDDPPTDSMIRGKNR